MKKIVIALVASSLVFFSVSAHAFESKIGQGATEVDSFLSMQALTMTSPGGESTKTQLETVSLGLHYFVTEKLSLGGSVLVMGVQTQLPGTDNDTATTSTYFQLDAKYHFYEKGQQLIPYVGVSIGDALSESQGAGSVDYSNAFMWTPRAGLKYFVNETTAINVELNYSSYTQDFGQGSVDISSLSVQAGLSVYF